MSVLVSRPSSRKEAGCWSKPIFTASVARRQGGGSSALVRATRLNQPLARHIVGSRDVRRRVVLLAGGGLTAASRLWHGVRLADRQVADVVTVRMKRPSSAATSQCPHRHRQFPQNLHPLPPPSCRRVCRQLQLPFGLQHLQMPGPERRWASRGAPHLTTRRTCGESYDQARC